MTLISAWSSNTAEPVAEIETRDGYNGLDKAGLKDRTNVLETFDSAIIQGYSRPMV
jgi:hypothetical protein